jgi:hypothetical protein
MDDRDPMEGDELRAIFNGFTEDEIDELQEPSNIFLDEVLEKFDCADLLPLVNRIIRLSSIKEVLGYIPYNMIPFDYEELQYLLIYHEEHNKKIAHESFKMRQQSKTQQSSLDNVEFSKK